MSPNNRDRRRAYLMAELARALAFRKRSGTSVGTATDPGSLICETQTAHLMTSIEYKDDRADHPMTRAGQLKKAHEKMRLASPYPNFGCRDV